MNRIGIQSIVLIAFIALHIGNIFATEKDISKDVKDDDVYALWASRRDVHRQSNTITQASPLYYSNEKNPNYSLFTYSLNEKQRTLLAQPNKIKSIKLNNFVLEFDDNARLPTKLNFPIITVLTCNNGNPILIRLLGVKEYYFYSKNPNTLKWTNHAARNLIEYQLVDKNGALYYRFGANKNFKSFYEKVSREFKSMAMASCNVSKIKEPPARQLFFEVEAKSVPLPQVSQPNVVAKAEPQKEAVVKAEASANILEKNLSLNPSYYYSNTKDPNYSLYCYSIESDDQKKLNHPNKLQYIRFTNKLLFFDQSAMLPTNTKLSSVTVYATKSNRPLLIRLRGYNEYCFYTLDKARSNWVNHNIDRLKNYEVIDENGIVCYRYDISVDYKYIFNKIAEECIDLCKKLGYNDNIVEVIDLTKPSLSMGVKVQLPVKSAKSLATAPVIALPARNLKKSVFEPLKAGFVIKPRFSYSNKKSDDFALYHYYLDIEDTIFLEYPNSIDRMRFNGRDLVFDENCSLPTKLSSLIISVFVCKRHKPILIRMLGVNGFYYFAPHLVTKRWSNYLFKDKKAFEFLDENDVICYKFNSDLNFKQFYDLVSEETSELSQRLCHSNNFKGEPVDDEPVLEIGFSSIKFKPFKSDVPQKSYDTPEPKLSLGTDNIKVIVPQQDARVEEVAPIGDELLVRGQLYYTALTLKYRLANQFTFLAGTLKEENIKDQHEVFVNLKHKEFNKIVSELDRSFSDFNNQTEKGGWIDVLPKLANNFADLKELNDEVYKVAFETFQDDEAKTFVYVSLIEKSNNLFYLLKNLEFILQNIEREAYDSEFETDLCEFDNSKTNFEKLTEKLLEEQESDKQEACFKEIVTEANKATDAFKKIINSVVNKKKDNGVEVKANYLKNVVSFIDKITNVSRSVLPGLFAMLFSGLFMFLV